MMNAMPGSPPESAAAAAVANDDDNNDEDNGGVDLEALRCRVCDLRRMLDVSADCLADTKADAVVACVECA